MKRIKSYFYNNGGLKVTIIGLTSLSVIIILFLISLSTIYFLYHESDFIPSQDEVKKYHYLQLNTETNEVHQGFSSFHTSQMTSDGFITYLDSNGYHVLISEFESDRYICRGRCYCEEHISQRRRRSTPTTFLSRGLITLVAAISSSVAIQLAKDRFSEDCHTHFSKEQLDDSCDSNKVLSEVDECELSDLIMSDSPAFRTRTEDSDDSVGKDEKIVCSGNCIARSWLNDDMGYWGFRDNYKRIYKNLPIEKQQQLVNLIQASHYFNCVKLKFDKEYNKRGGERMEEVRRKFEYDLAVFCQESSEVELDEDKVRDLCYECMIQYKGRSGNEGKDLSSDKIRVAVCTGTVEKKYNPTIQCVKVDNYIVQDQQQQQN